MIEVTTGKQKKKKETKEEKIISDMLISQSGFSWDATRKMILFIYFFHLLIRKVITIHDYNAW